MRDRDVRVALHAVLADRHRDEVPAARLVDELGLCGQVRVDVAVVNGALSGYELKSARDNLDRLPRQVDVYSQVLDYAYLVVAENHLRHARRELKPWWGIYVARSDGLEVRIDVARSAKPNPRVRKESLVQLLWKVEAIAALEKLGLAVGARSKPREVAWARLTNALDTDELGLVVRDTLKARREWRVDRSHDSGDARPRHERTTSRFLDRRVR